MKTIFDHIEYIQGKPHHVRKQVAFGVAVLGSSLIALVWFVGSYTTGLFSIKGSSFAEATGQNGAVMGGTLDQSGIAGVAAALSASDDTTPRIEVVNVAPIVTSSQQSEKTVLPF